ncbi:precorrin-6y C5,15-methyltransferase (decarboxylating) subunit CbiE [Pseudooceanicola sp. HF7]|uniref:precorrin-6y C5,15-methyltransferase (decarboxylating) subunit CbiE n=1 Tax=Pseudooceanicola sp. HF7 TaxID=2721560 RepID=UPI001431A1DF|nr:precorrin-6y C5,15-methyltransferase (decarboxylating) subunit CbiE [Pseudooceanicola sp. HF7]NIZ10709.1 precorrin-6y C5,15-methyltransferase (decarboxylating) subunit CbiE [Pseudooceanicola sp. HF7]
MAEPWLHIVGIGAEGMASLSPAVQALLESAEVILGGARHHALTEGLKAERRAWPSPFDALISELKQLEGRRVVVLATGDPLWYSVGARIAREIPEGLRFHPQLSAFQLAAVRMGWSLADLETLTAHGRPAEQVLPYVTPGARLLILTTGGETPGQIARLLVANGYEPSRITVLAEMGAPGEARFDGIAESWDHAVPAFNIMAVECLAGPDAALLPRVAGLPDEVFASDGTMTKREVRAVTLAKLMPMRGALLWDIGCGCGSVAVEWMRAARDARAIGIEARADRRDLAARNALELGAPGLRLVEGRVPEALADLPAPDAVFIGGGLSRESFDIAWAALKPLGRLVANGVTLESEALMLALHAEYGGELVRVSVERAAPIGGLHGWRPAMPVLQWSMIKR